MYDDAFLEQLDEFIPHLRQTNFFGGEPFLIKHYEHIWEKLIQKNPDCLNMIQTNGTFFTEKTRNIIKKGNFSIGVSLDSLNQTNYEKIRKNARFKDVMRNILEFHKILGKKFSIAVCPMQQNWQEMPNLVDFANSLDSMLFFNTVEWPPHCALKGCPANQLRQIHIQLAKYKPPTASATEQYNANMYNKLLKQINFWATTNAIQPTILAN
jgi:sulfatase maturation enzyme AslB (radical SAM superfamily)